MQSGLQASYQPVASVWSAFEDPSASTEEPTITVAAQACAMVPDETLIDRDG